MAALQRWTGTMAAAATAVALAGCGSSGDLDERMSRTPDTFLQITAGGAGGLDAATPYDQKAIRAKLPGFTTDTVTIGLEDTTTAVAVVFKEAYGGRIQTLHVVPSGPRIAEIHGVTHHVVGPGGERPGMSLRQAGVDPASCRIGRNLWLGMAICKSRAAANVELTFSFKGEAAMADKLPPQDVLMTGELQRIIWRPAR